MMFRSLKTYLSTLASVMLIASLFCGSTAEEQSTTPDEVSADGALANGFYLVLRSGDAPDKVQPIGKSEKLLSDDFHFLEPAEREPTRYLVLQTEPFVPLILGADPKEDRQADGKPRLQLQLAEDQKAPLERFTREHIGDQIAIVIGGEVVTCHKIRSVIDSGSIQITRCTDNGCEVLYTKLLKK